MKFKKIISFLLLILIALSVPFSVNANTTATLIACSDFQHPNGNDSGAAFAKALIQSTGISSADGFMCCGDYNYGNANTAAGINALKGAVSDVVTENMVFVRGNHDEQVSANVGLSQGGNNDTENYGVFVIHETDYMRTNSNETIIKKTAQNLINYFNEKLENNYNKPIFVLSHLPLHYNMRTRLNGDGKYANYLFDVMNEAGKKGLNIIFMYGHDHSNGWDDYLGGAAVYLKKGDSILIAQKSQTEFSSKTLQFTYMNAGFIGYYSDVGNGADTTLTMTAFNISEKEVEISRYNSESLHNLKSEGVTNSYKGESGYSPNTAVYSSPQTITLSAVNDSTPIADIIEDPSKKQGEKLVRITDASKIKDGGEYLLVCNKSSAQIMLPEVVAKSNGSTYRKGFNIADCDISGEDVYVMDDVADILWTFTKSGDGWLIGDGTNYISFTNTTDMSVTATLETTGDVFTPSVSDGMFSLSGSEYVLNYNSRGLVNGFAREPVPFYIYEYVGPTNDGCFMTNESTGQRYASLEEAVFDSESGDTIKLTADVTATNVILLSGITVDLNGFKVTANSFIGLKGSNVIDTSSVTDRVVNEQFGISGDTKTGGVYVSQDNVLFSNKAIRDDENKKNIAYMPVYDSQEGCFRFIQSEMRDNQFTVKAGKFVFMPIIGATANERNGIQKDLLATDNISKSGIKLKVRITWVTDGYDASQDFSMKDKMAKTFIAGFGYVNGDKFTNNYKIKNSAMFSGAGIKDSDYIYISALVVSQTGAELESIITTVDTSTL